MSKPARPFSQLAAAAAFACLSLLGTGVAHAENHALIMWIGDYADPKNRLPGIDRDAEKAKEMAERMGVPRGNIHEVMNQQLTLAGMSGALEDLTRRIKDGDKVFIYYSGHGHQVSRVGGGQGCSEGLVSHDGRLFFDFDLQKELDSLAGKASQLVVFNDSCFSGGAATKDFSRSPDGVVPKVYNGEVKAGSASDPGYACGQAVNKLARNLEAAATNRKAQIFYLAASADNEVAGATQQGSIATLAWAACMADPATDADRSGLITGAELAACAQRWVRANAGGRQTITAQYNSQLPMSFARPVSSTTASNAQRIDPAAALRNIASASDPSYRVNLKPANTSLRIKQDYLDFTVDSNKDGYLYVFQVGSDKKTFNVLYPNKFDQNNYVRAGNSVRLPGQSWQIRAAGPAGDSYLMAYVSPTRKDFTKGLDPAIAIGSLNADDEGLKTLVIEASGSNAGGSSRYGTSPVVAVREIN